MLWWVSVAPLGEPVVPLVNWMLIGVVELEPAAEGGERCPLGVGGERRHVLEGDRARRRRPADLDHAAQRRQARGRERARLAVASSGASVVSMPM